MLDTISQFLLSGNNDILVLIIMVVLCIGPLILMWRSTFVADRPYDQYAATSMPMGINLTDQVSASLSNNIPNPTNPFPAAGSTENLTETLPSEPTQSNEAVSEVTNDAQNVDSIPSTSSDNLTETSHIRKRQTNSVPPKLLPGQFYIRLKYLDETIETVQAKPTDTIGQFKQKVFPPNLVNRYRIIYKGTVLRNNNQTIQECGILSPSGTTDSDIPVVHCFLSPETNNQNQGGSSSTSQTSMEELNIGNFFLPMLGCILAFLWYLCIFHTSLFTIPSLFGIFGLTCFFIVIWINRYL